MNGRALTLVNAAGCLVLGLLLVLQWHKERGLDGRIQQLKVSLVAAQDEHAAACERVKMLESDQQMLKDSIGSLQQAVEAGGKLLAERDGEVADLEIELATLDAQVTALDAQLHTWQNAVSERDTRIRSLNAELTSARRRLDEAIAKLKAAATAR
ncbi:MAG: hypothetical protein WCK77_13810 [Verrucomicrobiota bacterium]